MSKMLRFDDYLRYTGCVNIVLQLLTTLIFRNLHSVLVEHWQESIKLFTAWIIKMIFFV